MQSNIHITLVLALFFFFFFDIVLCMLVIQAAQYIFIHIPSHIHAHRCDESS